MQKTTYQHAKTTCCGSCKISKTLNCGRRGSVLENQEALFQNVGGVMFELKIGQADQMGLVRERQTITRQG